MSLEKKSDEELMIQIASQEMSAFQEIITRHQQRALAIAYKLLGNWHSAEDVAQDTFIKIYSAAGNYKPQAKFTT
jgi:RNA polymerase sigma-70 factor (ECF subfamily)